MESTENDTIDQKPESDDEVDRLVSITAGALARLAPQLRERGVFATFGKNRNSRLITLTLQTSLDDDYSGATKPLTCTGVMS